jgi:hypothetical protein
MLVLPSDFISIIREGIGAKPANMVWDSIPCDTRPYLPELTFTIGGRNFTIDAFDYTFEYPVGFGYAPMCMLWFEKDDEMGGEGKQVMLGTPFLKGVYTTFDMDNKEIGCKLTFFVKRCNANNPSRGVEEVIGLDCSQGAVPIHDWRRISNNTNTFISNYGNYISSILLTMRLFTVAYLGKMLPIYARTTLEYARNSR